MVEEFGACSCQRVGGGECECATDRDSRNTEPPEFGDRGYAGSGEHVHRAVDGGHEADTTAAMSSGSVRPGAYTTSAPASRKARNR